MKLKATKKVIRENYNRIIRVGYCDAHYLLQYQEPFSYCSGVNGWHCDNYDVDNVCISTGYTPIGSRNTAFNYSALKEYEKAAREIVCDYTMPFEQKKKLVNNLLKDFIHLCIKGERNENAV